MRFRPDYPLEVIRLYRGGASIRALAVACCVSEEEMEQFLKVHRVFRKPRTIFGTKSNRTSMNRPGHINGKELSDEWWESNNQAFCDAMAREYPGKKFKTVQP